MKKAILVVLTVAALGIGSGLLAQFTAAEMADFDTWKDFVKTAKVVGREQLTGALAVTNPWVLTLEKDGIEHRALWKDIFGERIGGFKASWKGEIAGLPAEPRAGPEHGPADGRTGVPGQPGIVPNVDRSLEHHGDDHQKEDKPAGDQGYVFRSGALPPEGFRQPDLQYRPPSK